MTTTNAPAHVSLGDARPTLASARVGDLALLDVVSNTRVQQLRKLLGSTFTHAVIALGDLRFAQIPVAHMSGQPIEPLRHGAVISLDELAPEFGSEVGGFTAIRALVISPALSDGERAVVRDRAVEIASGSVFDTPLPSVLGQVWAARFGTQNDDPQGTEAAVVAYKSAISEDDRTRSTCFGLIVDVYSALGYGFSTEGEFEPRDFANPRDILLAFGLDPDLGAITP